MITRDLTQRGCKWTVLVGCLFGVLTAGTTMSQAAWQEPQNGWEVSYASGAGYAPDSVNTVPQWSRVQYGTGTSVTSDGSVQALRMDRANLSNPRWSSSEAWAQGTGSDLMTLDMTMRLVGSAEYDPYRDVDFDDGDYQFLLYISRPANAQQAVAGYVSQRIMLRMAQDKIFFGSTDSYDVVSVAIGTTYNDIRLHVDWSTGEGRLFLNDDEEAIAAHSTNPMTTSANQINWGHGTSDARGAIFLTDLKFTNSELAPIPEPTTLSVLAGVGGLLAPRRRRIQ
ncbi:MAG: hypothetical protein JXA11_02370 [Phycisphaerae bacterium]|nr:hypothetical protein [Phycisphaerae bacterium]